MPNSDVVNPVTMKDLKSSDPRWCTGCGDYTILVGLRKFMVQNQIFRENTVNISGIGCSGRIPHYMNTYGIHSIHGRAIPIALGIALAKPELKLFIHSGFSALNIYYIYPIIFCLGLSYVAIAIRKLSSTEPVWLISLFFSISILIFSFFSL